MKKNHSLLFLAVALLASNGTRSSAFAAEAYDLPEVVVTATKTLNSIADAGGSSVTVITEEEIRNSGKPTVEEVLKGTVGIDVVGGGGLGTSSSVFVRGADSKNVLLMVDGVAVNDPSRSNRNADTSNLTVDSIERIEIVRGPVSVLYGSNATAGVINIITKQGKGKPEFTFGVEGGSYGTWKAYGAAFGKVDAFRYSVNLARLKSDGFSIADDRNPGILHNGNTSEHDGYRNTTLSTNLGYQFSEQVDLSAGFRYTDAAVDLDDVASNFNVDRAITSGVWPNSVTTGDPNGAKNKHTDSVEFSGRVALKVNLDPVVNAFYYNFSCRDRDIYDNDNLKTNTYKGYLNEVGWQGDIAIFTNNTLSIGAAIQNEKMDNWSKSASLGKKVDLKSVFAQEQWHVDDLTLVAGLRYDDHQLFGGKTTLRVAPSYKIADTLLKFSYGTGFRAPSLFELYDPTYGNSMLKPETSKGWDAGLEQRLSANIKIGSTYFRTDYSDLISFSSTENRYSQVAGTTKTQGAESFIEWKPASAAFLTLSHTYVEIDAIDPVSEARRPKNKVGLSGSWKATQKLTLNTGMNWVGKRKEVYAKDANGADVTELDSYFIANVSAAYKLQPNVEVYGRVDNLFDKYYEEVWSYATSGRAFYAGVKVSL